jgi:hypothetical protein
VTPAERDARVAAFSEKDLRFIVAYLSRNDRAAIDDAIAFLDAARAKPGGTS